VASARPAVRPARIDTVAPMTPSAWLRYDVIERMLPAGVSDVLEIGCGQGALAARLSQRFRYLGIEPDKASWTIAARRLGAVGAGEARNISFDRLDGDQKFDLVCAFEVLEHIEDDTAAVKEWSARLREHGWLMLSVPAYQDRYGAADELVGHFRRYDPEAITGLLAGCGFEDIRVQHYGAPLGYALEVIRNQLSKRRLGQAGPASLAERTAGSGRLLQPSSSPVGMINRAGTAPFRLAQRAFPNAGPGIVVLAQLRPSAS
jgi:SAM-dependent methyltransferase